MTDRTVLRRACMLFAATVVLLLAIAGCEQLQVTQQYQGGALASAAPIATKVGEQIFADGGNAFDAAVATAFALAVVHPQAGNIGGGGFALLRDGSGGTVTSLDFRETAPEAATDSMYLTADGTIDEEASLVGAKAVGVPGTVAGLWQLHKRFGSMEWEALVQPARALADTGFVIDDGLAESLAEYYPLLQHDSVTAATFFPNGRPPAPGERLVQPELARTLYLIATEGADEFYTGFVANLIDSSMQRRGGLITLEDLAGYKPVWREPIRFDFDSLTIYSMPPPSSGGIVIGQILSILEPYDMSLMSQVSPEYLHLFAEASRLAFADRSRYLGDPAFVSIPTGLLDSEYVAMRRSMIEPGEAHNSEEIGPGTPPLPESESTTHLSVCDNQGNMVALTYTLNSSYGAQLMVAGGGFLLNNEMNDFSVSPGVPDQFGLITGEANRIEPGKRMLSSMSPTLVLKGDEPVMALGSPGGSKIISTVAQGILNYSRFTMSLSALVEAPRVHHQWLPDMLYMEQGGFPIQTTQALIQYGHMVKERSPMGEMNVVQYTSGGMLVSKADPRGRGSSGGY